MRTGGEGARTRSQFRTAQLSLGTTDHKDGVHEMATEADVRKGSFRLLQPGGQPMLAYEPAGADLANYEGEVFVMELLADTDPKALQETINFLNNHVKQVSLKDFSKK
jgi:hypothetical protein